MDVCKQVIFASYGTGGMFIKLTPDPVDPFIPYIMEEHELIPIPSKITVLKVIITRNTLSNHVSSLGTYS